MTTIKRTLSALLAMATLAVGLVTVGSVSTATPAAAGTTHDTTCSYSSGVIRSGLFKGGVYLTQSNYKAGKYPIVHEPGNEYVMLVTQNVYYRFESWRTYFTWA